MTGCVVIYQFFSRVFSRATGVDPEPSHHRPPPGWGACRHLTAPLTAPPADLLAAQQAQRLLIGPLFMCGDNPHLGPAFLCAASFLRQCLHRVTRRVSPPRKAASACLYTQCVCVCVCSSEGLRSIQRSRWSSGPEVTKGPRECLTHRRLSAFNGMD